MKLNKTIILAGFALVSLASCKKQLEKTPPQSLTSDLVFTNITAAGNALNGAYAPLRNSYYYGRDFTIMPDINTDNLIAASWFGNTYSAWQNWSFNSGTYEAQYLWQTVYNGINRVNNIIVNIDNVAPAPGEDPVTVANTKKSIKAQALALRALYYFDLLRAYSKIDINDKLGLPMVTAPTVEIMHARKTVKENYDQIVKDLSDAEAGIGNDNTTTQTRVSKYFINALQSRVYLYFKDYANAITAANKITGAGKFGYDTPTDYAKVWTDDASAKEIIFKIGIDAVTESGSVNLGVFFINDAGGSLLPKPDYIPSASIIAAYPDGDIRKGLFVKKNKLRPVTQNIDSVFMVIKYPGNPAFKAQSDKANAPKIFRYAEVALNKMEASYYTDLPTAKTLLKEIRAARIPGYNTALIDAYDNTTLLNEIRLERRRELAFEGHEFFDMKRWGIGFTRNLEGPWQATENAVGAIGADNYRWQYPIPQAERSSNKLCDQNPGYAN